MLVVQVCINDLKTIPLFPQWKTTIVANCKENIKQIVERAREQGTIVIVSTIFPVGHAPIARRLFWSEDIALAVSEVNAFIRSLAGEQVIIFDAFAILVDKNGRLVKAYGRDELHLNALGYETLEQEFEEVAKSLHE